MTNKYSVLMSVYYKEQPEHLKLAMQSIIEQTVRPDEFIIIKDGPLTENLNSVIDSFISQQPSLFTIIQNQENLGLGLSLAKGVLASKNELIARMDSDDWVVPYRCEKELAVFKADPKLGMVGSLEVEFMGTPDNVLSIHKVPETNKEIEQFMRRRCAVLHPTVMFKKSAVLRAGNYRDYILYEDYDLFARMVFDEKIKCYNLQEKLYYIRTSDEFFIRRGGISYAKTVLKFKWELFKKNNMSFIDFCISGLGQAFVCILPNTWRKVFYMKFLR